MRPLVLVAARPLMLLAVVGAVWLGYRASGRPDGLVSGVLVGQMCINAVNLVSFLLLRAAVRREGTRLRDLVAYRRDRLGRDIAWGLLWLLVLMTGFGIVLNVMPLALFRPDSAAEYAAAYTATFAGDVARADAVPVPVVLSVLSFVIFACTNPLVEEMTFRAYAQQRLVARWRSAWAGIGVPAFGFGLQHTLFAYSLAGMATFGVAFFVWGLLSGVIYYRQQRLVPLVTAHFVVNLTTGVALPIAAILS